jgi:hypothetical protein
MTVMHVSLKGWRGLGLTSEMLEPKHKKTWAGAVMGGIQYLPSLSSNPTSTRGGGGDMASIHKGLMEADLPSRK